MSGPRWALAVCLVASIGCRAGPEDAVWILPADPGPLAIEDELSPLPGALALPRASSAAVTSLWTAGAGPLSLGQVLRAVDASFPLLTVARQKRILVEAKQLKALGAFDLELGAKAQWNLEGFYENHTAGVTLEQATGAWGLRVLGGYRVGNGNFDLTFDGKRRINHGGEFSLGFALPVLQGGSFDASRRDLDSAGFERKLADSELAMLRLRYSAEAAYAYWDWVAAGGRQTIAESLLALAEVRQRGLEEALTRGAIAEIEVLDNRRLVVERSALVVKARRGIEKAALKLALFLRDAQGKPILPGSAALIPELPPGSTPLGAALEVDLEQALARRPDLLRLLQLREQERVGLRFAENELLPQLDLTVLASQDLDRRRPSVTKGEFELMAGLQFKFPLQNRKARGLVLESETRLSQLGETLRLARDKVALEVRDAFSELRAAHEREVQVREAASLARRVAEAERERFSLGDSTILKLNLREAYAAEAELKLVDALRDYWSAAARYAVSVGAAPVGPGL